MPVLILHTECLMVKKESIGHIVPDRAVWHGLTNSVLKSGMAGNTLPTMPLLLSIAVF
ncbi:MAG: hypothetical protein J6O55_07325 [Lachnospiraceae bacterium]|nr:hypothetical protein [Lachnospiraceae bacterium]